nr:stage II sporulation protein P [Oscillospiraceae bacterium]
MDQQYHRTLRVGITAILLALVFRLCAAGAPEALAQWLTQPNIAAFLIYLETGRDVRFSPSLAVFSPKFVESPPPAVPQPTESAVPSFSDPEDIDLYYASNVDPDLEALLKAPLEWDLCAEAPTVLILSTHSTESYTQLDEPYVESSAWRTLDEKYNMLSIGDRVAQLLEEAGIGVVRDRELHDYPSYNGSYVHARASTAGYLEEYPSIRLVLDLHRDAAGDDQGQMRTRAKVDGRDSAQLMLVLGTNHDGFEDNLSLALKLHAQLESQVPGIMRPLQLRSQRFNQDLSPGALLVEVGAAGNTHAEARLAAEKLAEAIIALAKGTN